MPVVYIRNLEQEGSKPVLCDLTTLSPGSPPNRPTPGPNPPGGGGPVDPGYSPPWAQVPPGSGPGGPVDPGYSPPWAQVPGGGTQVPEGTKVAALSQAKEQPTVPEGLPAGSVLMDVKFLDQFGKTQETQAWGLPYKSPHV